VNFGRRWQNVVDEERVTRLASDVRRDVARLRQLGKTAHLVAQTDQLDAVKYRFLTAIEGCIGIAHHITAAEGWAAPDSNADALRSLGTQGVVSSDLAEVMARAAGFRNLLVHRYQTIDDDAVVGFLDHLDQLEQFVDGVLAWLERVSGSGSDR
jgi:uncharacterized protein YutE (UPF0331/DUF86 family)